MLTKQLIFCVLVILSCVSALKLSDFPSFQDYIETYNKTYTEAEKITRKPLYLARLEILAAVQNYTPAVNQFSDWTEKELLDLKGLKFSGAQNSQNVATHPNKLSGPKEVDWTKTSVTVPKNQGRCGSCWAFAAVGYAQSKLIIDSRYDNSIDLSEQRLLECTRDSSCGGGYLEYAMDSVLNDIPFEFLFSYDYADYYGSPICITPGIKIGKITENYYDLSQAQLEQLVSERPIAISVWAQNWQNYGKGVFNCPINVSPKVNHAVLLVGYTDEYWIIKNSWGTKWGEGGFIRLTKTPGINCGIGKSAHRTFQTNLSGYLIMLVSIIIGILAL